MANRSGSLRASAGTGEPAPLLQPDVLTIRGNVPTHYIRGKSLNEADRPLIPEKTESVLPKLRDSHMFLN